MWRSIEIRNFRSLEHVKVVLAPFTVVVGPNSSGKSNFVDAFVFARDIAADASVAIQNRGGIASIRRWRPSKPVDVSIDVRVARSRDDLSQTYTRHAFTLASKKNGAWAFKREQIEVYRRASLAFSVERGGTEVTVRGPDEEDTFELGETVSAMFLSQQYALGSRLSDLRYLHKLQRFRLDPETMRRPQVATERIRLDESGSNLATAVQSLRTSSDKWEAVLAAMQKIIPGLTDIEEATIGRYMSLRFFQARPNDERAEFTATEMSEGAIRALGTLIASQQMGHRELMIFEEPEVSIHPGAAAVLFDALKAASRRGSVLITTHSPEFLDAANDEEIVVCDYRKGVTEVGPLDQAQRKLCREGLFSISELMRSEPLRIQGRRPELIED